MFCSLERNVRSRLSRNCPLLFEVILLNDAILLALFWDNSIAYSIRGAGDYHDDEMAKKDNELDARNAEIAKLREQVAFSVSRGQGDQPERDHSYEFRFKALEREVKETKYKYKKRDQEANDAVKEIGRLEKEISCLNRTVQRAGELQTQVDEMQLRRVTIYSG